MQIAAACFLFVVAARADFNNPNNYDNGADLHALQDAIGQQTYLLGICAGILAFIAFSTRFRQ
jgi:hypothetical protein